MHDGKCWFITNSHNALCTLDVESGDVIVEHWGLGGESGLCQGIYILAEAVGNKLVIMPKYAEKVLVYDTSTKVFDVYDVNIPELKGKSGGGQFIKFRSSVTLEDNVWLLPQSTGHILKYDSKKNEITDYTEWYKSVARFAWQDVNQFGFGILVKNSIWLPCYQINALVEFDTVTGEGKLHYLGRDDNKFAAVAYCKDKFWLIDNSNQEIVTWHPQKGIISVNKEFPTDYALDDAFKNLQDYKVAELHVMGEKIIAVPCTGTQFLSIDTESGNIDKIADKSTGSNYLHLCMLDKKTGIFLSQSDNAFCVIDATTNDIFKIYPVFDRKIIKKYEGVEYETSDYNLNSMLKNLDCNLLESEVSLKRNLCGEKIYKNFH